MFSVYMGAAIDSSNENPAIQFNTLCEMVMEASGGKAVIFNPFTAFFNAGPTRSKRTNEYVVGVNGEALMSADLAVFMWSEQPTFGVPIEISNRVNAQGHCIVWNVGGKGPGIYLDHLACQSPKCVLVSSQQAFIAAVHDYINEEHRDRDE
jgi:hypothetical protein